MRTEDIAAIFADYWYILDRPLHKLFGTPRLSGLPKQTIMGGLSMFLENMEDMQTLVYAVRNGGITPEAEQVLAHSPMPESLKKDFREAFQELSEDLARKVKAPKQPKQKPVGFVYLMQNTRNDLTKIGFSKDPKYREKTLQSEEPEVRLLASWPGTLGDEESLHEQYKKFRVRGEWFGLTWAQIDAIKEGRPQ